jgi:hypothetical protein
MTTLTQIKVRKKNSSDLGLVINMINRSEAVDAYLELRHDQTLDVELSDPYSVAHYMQDALKLVELYFK